MKTNVSGLRALAIVLSLLGSALSLQIIHAAGIVTSPTEANLRAAMVGGGNVTFEFDGTITLTNTLVITNETSLEASGRSVTLSGGGAVRLFEITPGRSLTLENLTITQGKTQGANGPDGSDGGEAMGGAIRVDSGTLTLINCRVWTNATSVGAGGNGYPNSSGGAASGGAIYLDRGTLAATNTEFVGNMTLGGPGGINTSLTGYHVTGKGGAARAGAIHNMRGQMTLDHCLFASNGAIGGRAPFQTYGGASRSGAAEGAALFNDGGTNVLTRCSFVLNAGSSPGIDVVYDAYGGSVGGGAVYNAAGLVSITETEFRLNRAVGGAGKRYGDGGQGQGGAIFNLDQLTLNQVVFQNNSAAGGDDGIRAADGRGGAIFNGGRLQIEKAVFDSNLVTAGLSLQQRGGNFNGIAQGGAIYSSNFFALNGSTFSANYANGALGGRSSSPAEGGAIYNTGNGHVTNCTLAANVAARGNAGGNGIGGGLFNTNGTVALVNSTFDGNGAVGGPFGIGSGGGVANTNGVISLLNTIIANSFSGGNSSGPIVDAGHNLSSDQSFSFSAAGSLNNIDPKLGPLDDYGGPTPTIPLLAGSPAIDAADNVIFPSTDQRGRGRPFGSAPDIGAFESSPPYTIRGQVSGFTLKDEVAFSAGSQNTTTTSGRYGLGGLTAGSYAVQPAHSNYVFVPDTQSVAVGPDQVNINFKAYRWNALSIESAGSNTLHLIFAGTNGQPHRVLATSNLVDWVAISTNVPGPGNFFEVFGPTDKRILIYRVQSP